MVFLKAFAKEQQPTEQWLRLRQRILDSSSQKRKIDEVSPDTSGNLRTDNNAIVPFDKPTATGQAEPKRLRFGDEDTNMDSATGDTTTEGGTLALRAGSSGSSTQGAHETPVLEHPPMFRFKETLTTIIPTTFYFSANALDTDSTSLNKFEIRLNSPYSPIITPGAFVTQTASTAVAEGISATVGPDSDTNFATLGTFPITTTVNHKPQWLAWWEQMYQAYHVMETQYEITVTSARSNAQAGALVLWEEDQYGSSSTGNIMPDGSLDEMAEWVGTKQKTVRGTLGMQGPYFTKIVGTWKPGQANRNTTNDGDIKTWNATGAIPSPAYVESLHLRFFRQPMQSMNPASIMGVNVQVKLKYIVQFKDLNSVFRYPVTGGTAIDLIAPTDVLKTA